MGPVTSELKRGITQNGMVGCVARPSLYLPQIRYKKVVVGPFTRFWQKKKDAARSIEGSVQVIWRCG